MTVTLVSLKTLKLTDDLKYRIAIVRRAQDHYRPSLDAPAVIETPKAELVEAILAAIDAQEGKLRARQAKLAQLPRPSPLGIVEVELRRKRRRA